VTSKKDIFDLIVPIGDREKTVERAYVSRTKRDRCAARVQSGDQCKNALNSGQGGGYIEINGVRVPLCTTHYYKALLENWERLDRPEPTAP
jgi:hypothetical protein